MKERCGSCGRPVVAHLNGACPRLDTHVVIDALAVERLQRSGHPRLLGKVLTRQPSGMFAGVEITNFTVDGVPVQGIAVL